MKDDMVCKREITLSEGIYKRTSILLTWQVRNPKTDTVQGRALKHQMFLVSHARRAYTAGIVEFQHGVVVITMMCMVTQADGVFLRWKHFAFQVLHLYMD